MNLKPIHYTLEIHRSDTPGAPLAQLNSASPFMAIHVGDSIDSRAFPNVFADDGTLTVTRINHFVSEHDASILHTIAVYVDVR